MVLRVLPRSAAQGRGPARRHRQVAGAPGSGVQPQGLHRRTARREVVPPQLQGRGAARVLARREGRRARLAANAALTHGGPHETHPRPIDHAPGQTDPSGPEPVLLTALDAGKRCQPRWGARTRRPRAAAQALRAGVRRLPRGLPAGHAACGLLDSPHERAGAALRHRRLAGRKGRPTHPPMADGQRRHAQPRIGPGAPRPDHAHRLVRAQAPAHRARHLAPAQRPLRIELHGLPHRGRPRPIQRARPAHAPRPQRPPARSLGRLISTARKTRTKHTAPTMNHTAPELPQADADASNHPPTAQPQPRGRLTTDAPTRAFHWLFALSFAGAWLTAESERWRDLHITLGYAFGGLLVRWRRVSGLGGWLRSALASQPDLPRLATLGMGAAVLLLLLLAAPLVLSGYAGHIDWLGLEDALAELHEFFANALMALVLAHLALIAVLSLMRRKNTALPMLTGRTADAGPDLVKANRGWLAILLVATVLGFVAWQASQDFGQGTGTGTAADMQAASGDDDDED